MAKPQETHDEQRRGGGVGVAGVRCGGGAVTLTFGSLFAGIGGMDLGLERAGMRCVWQVEVDPYARRVLEKHWPDVRRHDDVRTFPPTDAGEWGCDLICGGFPCQDVSVAGKGAGIRSGTRSGLWFEFARIIGVLRPRFAVVENVAALLIRGIDRVLGDLATLGYDAEWQVFTACEFGAPQSRERVFIVAHRDEIGRGCFGYRDECEHEVRARLNAWKTAPRGEWRDVERWSREVMAIGNGIAPATERSGVVDGLPNRLDRIATCGNAVVPQVAQWIGERILAAINAGEAVQ